MTVNILGTEYIVDYIDAPTQYMKDNQLSALCDYNIKKILISTKFYGGDLKTEEYKTEDLIHELAHVFLRETGQDDINDERTVEVMSKFYKFIKGVL